MAFEKLTRIVLLTLTSGVVAFATGCSGSSKSSTAESTPSAPSPTSTSPASTDKVSPGTNKPADILSLESSIASKLFLPKGINVSSIDCPSDAQIKTGSAFDCEATTAQGSFKVGVMVTNDQGNMNFKTKGLLMLPAMEKVIPEGIKQQTGADVAVDCGSKKSNIRTFKTVGESFKCDVIKDGNKDGAVTVTVTGENGEINWAL